ncbi:ABC transporter permease [Corynebacterium tuberculostearicum]|uniref:ABC transporter permease n=1 Tax=Corynebacterium tuberculostearicum TaxID=38304 RepID=UPI00266510EA|nr:ABC transporter permease [Corynebacterium tuberculostearicum]WKE51186.1 ABC transporter permease [Corynebacterium tuberculostearicum]
MTSSTSSQTAHPTAHSETAAPKASSLRRLRALSRAELRQFTRNPLLVIMALLFPAALPLFVWIVGDQSIGSTDSASEIFVLLALGFGIFYPSLSMTVTRRDEEVLKRLRTGESRDWEILTAIALPLAATMLLLSILMVTGLSTMSMFLPLDPPVPHVWPVNALLMALAMVFGIVCSHAVAMLTSSFTANAENAQITSMPVLMLLMFSQSSLRSGLPDALGQVLDATPFALAVDIVRAGWIGDGSFASVFADSSTDLIKLAAWTVVLVWAAHKYMRWDTHR